MENMKNCPFCDALIQAEAKKCRYCGKWLENNQQFEQPKEFLVTLLLSAYLGYLGLHRFYTGYIGIGIIQLLTFGGCGIWSTIDFVAICFNLYKDVKEQPLYQYNKAVGMVFFFLPLIFIILIMLLVFLIIKYMPCHGHCPRG